MDYFDFLLNIICFGLLFAFFPSGLLTQQHEQHSQHTGANRQLHGHLHPVLSPIASPRSATFDKASFDYLAVPSITVTPDHIAHPRQKRKSVSFSISSLDDVIPRRDQGEASKRRPPTPFVSGPVSPSQWSDGSPDASAPGTPLTQNVEMVDPMGVQKKWLMA